jgi:transcription elongation GreA/GreB family factor
MTKKEIKIQLLKACKEQLASRREAVDSILANVAQSLREETKSSAGDKHETGRAMLQLERENAGKQLAEIEKLEAILNRVSPEVSEGPVHLGCVVETSQANYFLSIPSGELPIGDMQYYAIGIGSPMGKLLLGNNLGDEVHFRESTFKISSVF